MTYDNEIQPVVATQFGGGNGAGDIPMAAGGPAEADAAAPPPKPKLDQVTLTPPRLATLRLLRSRVLEHTRQHLDLGRPRAAEVAFAGDSDQNAQVFVGRLLSTQNLMAAERRESWPEEQINQALEEGISDGLAETLDALEERGVLDAENWRLVGAVMDELHRKVLAVGGSVAGMVTDEELDITRVPDEPDPEQPDA